MVGVRSELRGVVRAGFRRRPCRRTTPSKAPLFLEGGGRCWCSRGWSCLAGSILLDPLRASAAHPRGTSSRRLSGGQDSDLRAAAKGLSSPTEGFHPPFPISTSEREISLLLSSNSSFRYKGCCFRYLWGTHRSHPARTNHLSCSNFAVPPVGIEPTTFGLKVRCSAS